MATPTAFAGVEELQDTLQTTIARDAGVSALRRATAAIRGYVGWNVSVETVTDYVVQNEIDRYSRRFWLPTQYLTDVSACTEDGVVLTPGVHFAWRRTGLMLRAAGWWSINTDAVVVSFTHGYPPGHRNLEVARDVCLAAAARIVTNPQRHSSETTGSETWQSGILQAGSTLSDGEKAQLDGLVLS